LRATLKTKRGTAAPLEIEFTGTGTGAPDIDYPFTTRSSSSRCGRICADHKKINFSATFAGQAVGIKEVHDGI